MGQERFTVMGVLNVTPDSFSDGGEFADPDDAAMHGLALLDAGASLLDIGGESTRPGATPISGSEELERVLPVIERLHRARPQARLSIDTYKLSVVREAVAGGVRYVNDVTAFRADPEIANFVADHALTCCLMHMRGQPGTMQDDPVYDDVVDEVKAFLSERIEFAIAAGIPEHDIQIDPGIGFGKTVEHNLELLRRVDELVALGRPVVIGTSRKRFLGAITGKPENDRIAATVASNVLALQKGAQVFRVHDVGEVIDGLRVADAVLHGHVAEIATGDTV